LNPLEAKLDELLRVASIGKCNTQLLSPKSQLGTQHLTQLQAENAYEIGVLNATGDATETQHPPLSDATFYPLFAFKSCVFDAVLSHLEKLGIDDIDQQAKRLCERDVGDSRRCCIECRWLAKGLVCGNSEAARLPYRQYVGQGYGSMFQRCSGFASKGFKTSPLGACSLQLLEPFSGV